MGSLVTNNAIPDRKNVIEKYTSDLATYRKQMFSRFHRIKQLLKLQGNNFVSELGNCNDVSGFRNSYDRTAMILWRLGEDVEFNPKTCGDSGCEFCLQSQ